MDLPSTSHFEKQAQNGHAEDIIVKNIILTELFCARLLHNTAPAYQPLLYPPLEGVPADP
jgi:hypothetical protein